MCRKQPCRRELIQQGVQHYDLNPACSLPAGLSVADAPCRLQWFVSLLNLCLWHMPPVLELRDGQ